MPFLHLTLAIKRDIFTPLFLGAKLFIPPAEVITYELLADG